MSVIHGFVPGNHWAIGFRWRIPRQPSPMHMEVVLSFSLSRAYTALERTYISFFYTIRGEKQLGTVTPVEMAFQVGPERGLTGLPQWKKMIFTIRSSRFVGRQGGMVNCRFMTLSQSTGPILYVDEFHRKVIAGDAGPRVRIE